jgi:hypothetical protein
MCSLGCLDLQKTPPFDIVCASNCISRLCNTAASLYQPAINCAIRAAVMCRGSRGCIQQQCAAEMSACANATCP